MDRQASRAPGGSVSRTAGSGTAGVDPTEFAEYLRAERERRSLTLDQIADETKIASRHLAALERGDVRNWPGGMYRRAMMRAYAESIGVDREYALKQFEQAFEPPPARVDSPAPVTRASARFTWRPSRKQLLASGASMLTIVAAAIAWSLAGSLMRSDTGGAGTTVTERTAAVPVLAAGPAAVPTTNPSRPVAATSPPRESVATTGSTEPRPAATEGDLVVTSQPAGARVTVNGIGWGQTPITIRHVEFGPKRVRLTLQGYISQERVVSLGPDRPHGSVRFALTPRE